MLDIEKLSGASAAIFLFFLSSIFLFPLPSSAAPNFRDIKAGDYLFDGYASRIEKKEAPCFAARAVEGGATEINAVRKGGMIKISVGNFHEGVTDFSIGKNGEIMKGIAAPPKTFQLNPDGSLLLTLGKEPTRRFIYVGNAGSFVTKHLLPGSYIDSSGVKYSLGKDGMASFGPVRFPYEMELDCVGAGNIPGWIMNPKTDEGYVFELVGQSLLLYRYDVQESESESKPIITARKAK